MVNTPLYLSGHLGGARAARTLLRLWPSGNKNNVIIINSKFHTNHTNANIQILILLLLVIYIIVNTPLYLSGHLGGARAPHTILRLWPPGNNKNNIIIKSKFNTNNTNTITITKLRILILLVVYTIMYTPPVSSSAPRGRPRGAHPLLTLALR